MNTEGKNKSGQRIILWLAQICFENHSIFINLNCILKCEDNLNQLLWIARTYKNCQYRILQWVIGLFDWGIGRKNTFFSVRKSFYDFYCMTILVLLQFDAANDHGSWRKNSLIIFILFHIILHSKKVAIIKSLEEFLKSKTFYTIWN